MTKSFRAVGLAAALFGCACASALKEPPPVAELGGRQPGSGAAEVTVTELLTAAAADFSRAPEVAAVVRSRELYLEATTVEEAPLEAFLGANRATAWLVENLADAEQREQLATSGVQVGQWCRRRFPDEPECRYRLALAVGQQAREKPSTAVDGLDVMVTLLEQLIAEAPDLDSAGPYRVLALVLLRAPGWPSGPGDPELGLEHAAAAVEAFPGYPPNQLVLGEALLENERPEAGRRAIEEALALAEKLAADGDAEALEWAVEARAALAGLR